MAQGRRKTGASQSTAATTRKRTARNSAARGYETAAVSLPPAPPAPPPPPRRLASDLFELLLDPQSSVRLYIGYDYGTKASTITWAISEEHGGLQAGNLSIYKVRIGTGYRVPTETAVIQFPQTSPEILHGEDFAQYLGQPVLKAQNVFRFGKLSLIPSDEPAFQISRARLLQHHQSQEKAIASYPKQVVVSTSFLGTSDVPITDSKTLVAEFHKHMLDCTLLDVQQRSGGLKDDEIKTILRTKTEICVAVPAIWRNEMIVDFRDTLSMAQFPNALIASEPKCVTAAVGFNRASQFVNFMQSQLPTDENQIIQERNMVLDIGSATADVHFSQLKQVKPYVKVQSLAQGEGDLTGSQLLNDLCKKKLLEWFPTHLAAALTALKAEEPALDMDEFLERFIRDKGFESVKRNFGKAKKDIYQLVYQTCGEFLPESTIPNSPFTYNVLNLTHDQMKTIFDEYLVQLMKLPESQMQKMEDLKYDEDEQLRLLCCGGGPLIPYVFKAIEERFSRDMVIVSRKEDLDDSLVAQGALLCLLDRELATMQYVRASYGTVLTVPFIPGYHNEADAMEGPDETTREVPNRGVWKLIKDKEIDPKNPPVLEGILYLYEPYSWPLVLEHPVYKSEDPNICYEERDFDALKYDDQLAFAGELRTEVKQDECKFKEYIDDDGCKYFAPQFRAIPHFDGMFMDWEFIVAYNGIFPKEGGKYEHGPKAIRKRLNLRDALDYPLQRSADGDVVMDDA